MKVTRAKYALGPTSILEEARLTGDYAGWHNLLYEVAWLTGRLDLAAVRDAWWQVCMRHDVLRRTYAAADEARTHDDVLSEVEFYTAETDAEAIHTMRRTLGIPFDLDGPAFSRIVIVQRDERRHLLGIAVDHIIGDRISCDRLSDDFVKSYEHAGGREVGHTREEWTYQRFASKQRHEFASQWGERCRAFWHSYTAEFGTFPPPFPASGGHTGEPSMKVIGHELPVEAKSKVRELSLAARATPFAVVASGVLSGMREVTGAATVGLTANHHGRVMPGTFQTVGLFTQTIPLHLGQARRSPLETVRGVFHQSLDVSQYMVPLRVAGNSWSENLVAPGTSAGVFVGLGEGISPPSNLALAGTEAETVDLEFPGALRPGETVVISWHLNGSASRLVASYNENFIPTALVEDLLRASERFALRD